MPLPRTNLGKILHVLKKEKPKMPPKQRFAVAISQVREVQKARGLKIKYPVAKGHHEQAEANLFEIGKYGKAQKRERAEPEERTEKSPLRLRRGYVRKSECPFCKRMGSSFPCECQTEKQTESKEEKKQQGYHKFKILKGKGWHQDHIRHSNARRYGRA